jgi:hypothetical protein
MDWRDRVTRLAPPPHCSLLHRSLSHCSMKTRPHAEAGDLARDLPPPTQEKQLKLEHGAGAVWTDTSRQFLLLEWKKSWLVLSKEPFLGRGRRFHRTRCTLAQMPPGPGPLPPSVRRAFRARRDEAKFCCRNPLSPRQRRQKNCLMAYRCPPSWEL